ncbi:hypothetical protein LAZ67_3005448 [Cordylochernes scorpioides]|uniref:Uncharacterized protein n=1 Tax=Cordylochernes scorpioides TaxID=51811 RepID=A0ABY6KBN9_9ARAC|nr:hypothetical protein LAZ67_3005448 [Cordylochernes scorpioides]
METSVALHWTRQQQKIDIDPEQQLYTLKIVDIAVIEISPGWLYRDWVSELPNDVEKVGLTMEQRNCSNTREFKRSRKSKQDEPRPGRPMDITTPEIVSKIHCIVTEDRRVKIREIAENIPLDMVHHDLHVKLQI